MTIARGLYRHYKGNLYMVDSVGKHTETLEDMVSYHAMYTHPEFGPYAQWVRPAKMFVEEVEVKGQKVPRFAKLADEESVEILKNELMKLMKESNDQ
jgi:hypothetical protein